MISRRRWLQSPVHRGERGISRKPLRRECRLIRPNLWSLPPAFLFAGGPWVRSSPGIPCTLCFREGDPFKLGQLLPRECVLLRIRLFDNQISSRAGEKARSVSKPAHHFRSGSFTG